MMRVLVTGHLGYIGNSHGADVAKGRPRCRRSTARAARSLLAATFVAGGTITEVPHIRKDVRDARQAILMASMPLFTWPRCRTTR